MKPAQAGGRMEPMLSQEDFNNFVGSYNADYIFLLTRASHGNYDCLISSFRVLKDLYDVLMKLHDTTLLEFVVIPYPLSFRSNAQLLTGFNFNEEQIDNIQKFLGYVKQTQGREFEECIEEALPSKCAR
jgi:hypothetical protein